MYEFLANLTLYSFDFYFVRYLWRSIIFFSQKFYIFISCLIWGLYIEFNNSTCPLTYLENWFLHKSGLITYTNSFINNYILAAVYPNNLTVEFRYTRVLLLVINIFTME